MTTITSRWPPTPLPYTFGQTGKPGLSDLIAIDAATLATLEGHVMGGDQVGGDVPNPAPINPSGDFGHDHSGGWFGRPLFRSVASHSFDDGRSYTTSIDPGVHWGAATVINESDGLRSYGQTREFSAWVPPCDAGVDGSGNPYGAYRKLGVCITGELEAQTGTLVSGDEIHVEIWRMTDGSTRASLLDFTVTTSPSVGTVYQATSGATTRLLCIPGRINYFATRFYLDRQGTGAGRGCTFEIQEVEIGVYST